MHVFHALRSYFLFTKEKPVFPVLIPLRQRIALCFHTLHAGIVRWLKPRSTSLLFGTIADLAKGRSELMVENALLRQQLIILRRHVKRPACRKTDRFLLVLFARMLGTWKQALFVVQPETVLRWHRELFRLFWKHTSKTDSRQPKISPETIALIKEMASTNRRLPSRAHSRRVAQAGYARVQTHDPEIHAAHSPTSSKRAEVGDLPA
jgi:putative transposase